MKAKAIYNGIETCLNVLGVYVSITDLENIINIILLCVSVASILFRLGYSIYEKIKSNRISDIQEDLDKAQDDLEKIADKISKEDKENGDNEETK